jgi:uncharacterized membrane protein
MKTQSLANRALRSCLTISLLVAIVGLGTVAAQPAVSSTTSVTASGYTITTTDLGTLPGGTYSSAWEINNRNQIVGMGYDATGSLVELLWDDGVLTTFPNFDPCCFAMPEEINDSREVVGTESIAFSLAYGVYWDATGAVFGLPPIPNNGSDVHVRAHGINNSSQIVGVSGEVNNGILGPWHAVLWQGTTLVRDLGVIGEPWGINDVGDIVGNAVNGFLWHNGSIVDLGGFPNGLSAAVDINNLGVILGNSGGRAATWQNGTLSILPALPGRTVYNIVTDISNNNDVAGYGMASGDVQETGILWRNGQAIELGRLPGGTVSRAYGINDKGQIVGEANTPGPGPFHGVLWTVTSSNGPTVVLVPTSLKWGKVLVGSTGATRTITLTNTGSATLNIGSIVVTGDFTQKTGLKSCGATVAAGASCLIRVQFKPQQVGVRTGEVMITDDAPDSPQRVSLTGTGK